MATSHHALDIYLDAPQKASRQWAVVKFAAKSPSLPLSLDSLLFFWNFEGLLYLQLWTCFTTCTTAIDTGPSNYDDRIPWCGTWAYPVLTISSQGFYLLSQMQLNGQNLTQSKRSSREHQRKLPWRESCMKLSLQRNGAFCIYLTID